MLLKFCQHNYAWTFIYTKTYCCILFQLKFWNFWITIFSYYYNILRQASALYILALSLTNRSEDVVGQSRKIIVYWKKSERNNVVTFRRQPGWLTGQQPGSSMSIKLSILGNAQGGGWIRLPPPANVLPTHPPMWINNGASIISELRSFLTTRASTVTIGCR